MAIRGIGLPRNNGKWNDAGCWMSVTPLEMLQSLNNWCRGGCKTIYRCLLVEDDPKQKGGSVPFKSQKQRAKFYQLQKEGKISKRVVEEWEKATRSKRLPEYVPKKKGK